jgi:hypothetical protein
MLKIHLSIKEGQPPIALSPTIITLPTCSLQAEAVVLKADAVCTDGTIPGPTDIPPEAGEFSDAHLKQVLRLAERGFRLFPLAPHTKKPMKDFGWKDLATNDKQQLVTWFNEFPECNWGMATGPVSNVFVLDVDGAEGRDSLNSLGGKLPQTLTTQTGKPFGLHLWFEYPANAMAMRNSAGALGPGLDIRTEGGYVVVPPSIHPNGKTYAFVDEFDEIVPAPDWLLELIACSPETPNSPHFDIESKEEVIPVGKRDDTLFRYACGLRRKGTAEEEIGARLREANKRCEQPLSEAQLKKIAHSASRYEPARKVEMIPTLTLDPAALYGVAGKVVGNILPHTEADEAALLLHLLAGYGSIVGRRAHCKADGAKHYANLFFACVGATAKGRKGTSWNQIRGILERVDQDWAQNRIQGGLSSGEGLIAAAACWGVTAPDPDTPVEDKRLFIVQSEFASTLKVMTREGNTLSPTIRDAWDTGSFQVMVKRDPVKYDGAHITIVGHITCEELRRYLTLTESANGFANRFLWARSERSKCLPEAQPLSEEAMTYLAELLRPAVDFGRKVDLLQRDVEATKLWAEVYPELSEGQLNMFGAVTSRAEAQVLRLSMLYALLDCSIEIRRPHLEAALAVWEYCEQTAWWIFGARVGDSTADKIRQVLGTCPEGMTRNEIMDYFNRHKSSQEIGRALALLLNEGHVYFVDSQNTGGRQAQIWKAVRD